MKWRIATILPALNFFATNVFTEAVSKNKARLTFANTAETKENTNKEDIMGAIMGATTQQAKTAFIFLEMARRHGIEVEFDFSDQYNPKVNFIGGTYEQHSALALELAEKFEEV